MNEKLTKAQLELLMYIYILEDNIKAGKIDMTFDDALDSLFESCNFDVETLEELNSMGYIDTENQLTHDGRVFAENQQEKEEKEAADAELNQKNKRTDRLVEIFSSVVGGVAGEVIKKLAGGDM